MAAALGLAGPRRDADPTRPPATDNRASTPRPIASLVDALGDPLPPGAVARLGTNRLMDVGQPHMATFSTDRTRIATWGSRNFTVWDATTGRQQPQVVLHPNEYAIVPYGLGWRKDGTGVAIVALNNQSNYVSAFNDDGEKRPDTILAARAVVPGPEIRYLALSPDASLIAVVRDPGAKQFTIELIPALTGQLLASLTPQRTLGPFPGPCREIRYTSGQIVTLHGSWEESGIWSISVIDPNRNAVVRTSAIPAPAYCARQLLLSLSADAHLAAVVPRTKMPLNANDGTIRVWDSGRAKGALDYSRPWERTGDWARLHAGWQAAHHLDARSLLPNLGFVDWQGSGPLNGPGRSAQRHGPGSGRGQPGWSAFRHGPAGWPRGRLGHADRKGRRSPGRPSGCCRCRGDLAGRPARGDAKLGPVDPDLGPGERKARLCDCRATRRSAGAALLL